MDHQSNMKLHLLTLKFSGDSSGFETPFQCENFRASLPHNRAALIVGVIFYSVFGILDALLMPEKKSTIWLIRFALVDPLLIGALLLSFSKSFERYVNPLITFVTIVAGGGIICMIAIAPRPVSYSYYAGLLLVFIWCYTFIRIPFLWASFAGWVIVILYEITAIWIIPTPVTVLINNNFFFISANIMGMIACYSLEYYARRNFFLTQQIEMERKKINRANRTLEREIAERERMGKALQESEELYRTALESSNDGVAIIQDGRFVYANTQILFNIGRSWDELMNSNLYSFVHPEDQESVISHYRKNLEGIPTPNHLEIKVVLPDSAIMYADVSMVKVIYKGNNALLL